MMKTTRFIAAILSIGMLTTGLAGCGGGGQPVSESSAPEATGPTVTSSAAGLPTDSSQPASDVSQSEETQSGGKTDGKKTTTVASKGSAASKPGTTSSSGSSSSSNTPVIIDPGKTKLTEKKVDLKGQTIKIATYWEPLLVGTINGKPATEGSDASGMDAKAIADYKKAIADIEKDYNCKIQFIYNEAGDFLTQVSKAASANTAYADIMHITPSDFFYLAPAGVTADITNSVISPKDVLWNSDSRQFSTLGGKIYGVEYISQNIGIPLRTVLFFNKDLLNTYAKGTDLYAMVKNGTWTWDEFSKLCTNVKKNSGSKAGGITAYFPSSLGLSLVSSNGAYIAAPSGKGYAFAGTDNAAIEALTFFQKIKSDGNWVAPDESQKDNKRILVPFMNGKCLFMVHDFYLAKTDLMNNMEDDYGIVPMPKGPDAKEYYGRYGESTFYTFNSYSPLVKSGDAQKVLLAIALRTYLKDWKAEAQKSSLRDKESLEMMEIMLNNPIIDITARANYINNLVSPQLDKIFTGSVTPKAAMQSIAGTAAKGLKDIFG